MFDHLWGLPVTERVLLAGRRPDVYHVLGGGLLPRISKSKTVVTFFDLMTEAFPKEGTPDPGRRIADPYTAEFARRADFLVATGYTAKRDLMNFYSIPGDRIEVIPTGVNLKTFQPVLDAGRLERSAGDTPFRPIS